MVAQAAAVDRKYFHQDHGVGRWTALCSGMLILSEACFADRNMLPWLAVECINGCEMSHASDVWAAGVLLWEMFNYGTQKPFEGLLPSQARQIFSITPDLVRWCASTDVFPDMPATFYILLITSLLELFVGIACCVHLVRLNVSVYAFYLWYFSAQI